jgi:O-antigen ligase
VLWAENISAGISILEWSFFNHYMTILLVIAISLNTYSENDVVSICKFMMYMSFFMGMLTVLFAKPYHGTFINRLTLTILGVQMDPNELGCLLIYGIIFAILNMDYNHSIQYLVFSLINIIAIFYTSSRGTMLSLLVLSVFMIAARIKSKEMTCVGDREKSKITYKIIAISIIVIIMYNNAKTIIPMGNIYRVLNFETYKGGSGREDLWRDALAAIHENPIIGKGWGGSLIFVHNTYINMVLDVGIIGFSIFILFFLFIAYIARKKNRYEIIVVMLTGMIPSFFLEGLTKKYFWNGIIMAIIMLNREYNEGQKLDIYYKSKS